MRLLPIAKKQGLVLQRSRLGLVSALRPTVLSPPPPCIGKKGYRSTMCKEAPSCSSSWLLESKVILILSLVRGANPNSRWRIGSEQFCGKGNVCCWRKHSLRWLQALLGLGRFTLVQALSWSCLGDFWVGGGDCWNAGWPLASSRCWEWNPGNTQRSFCWTGPWYIFR